MWCSLIVSAALLLRCSAIHCLGNTCRYTRGREIVETKGVMIGRLPIMLQSAK